MTGIEPVPFGVQDNVSINWATQLKQEQNIFKKIKESTKSSSNVGIKSQGICFLQISRNLENI